MDVLEGKSLRIEVPNAGYVILLDCLPRLVQEGKIPDQAIADAARISYGKGTRAVSNDVDLIRFLMRHRHSSPFEMVVIKFCIKAPIFVARQLVRHRMTSWNEKSLRYSEAEDEFYVPAPEDVKVQSKTNKQCSGEVVSEDVSLDFLNNVEHVDSVAMKMYEHSLQQGVSRELSRISLPVNIYTEWVWEMNLKSFFHIMGLRLKGDAQDLTRKYAEAMFKLVEQIYGEACRAFRDYELETVSLSKMEVEAIRNKDMELKSKNSREKTEYLQKLQQLGLEFPK